MSNEPFELVGLLEQIAEIGGEEAARLMARRFGGGEVYIPLPRAIREGHPLAQCIGVENARRLAREIGRGFIKVPLGRVCGRGCIDPTMSRLIENSLREGLGRNRIARVIGVSLATVGRYIQSIRDGRSRGATDPALVRFVNNGLREGLDIPKIARIAGISPAMVRRHIEDGFISP